ncbi:radical SAM protein [Desulfurivibrio alkaliphilus]|uniref:Radical SAM domain protein n=1 Tax=Desulfurivibrio alkaliphilus (strain DSM 19089 / UNIQEM U267 / AHT2) TaxID=589865 RepID=D6Z3P5_DESAT|nr:radical SAM protein [Desulfurivibrio alkaliphilus]ADH86170.1 Radical SAM domain protein [Desulfurivibrio alkaliphilus AHT 2]
MGSGHRRRPGARSRRRQESSPPDLLQGERGTWRRKWGHRLTVALIFPNTYPVATSNLGLQLVYDLLNEHPGVLAERFVLPPAGEPPRSLESGRPLTDFSLLCYSLSFEGDSLNLLRLLATGGVELAAERRGEGDPLVIGGGVATWMSPEPLAPATDLFLIGEAEVLLPPVLQRLVRHHREQGSATGFAGSLRRNGLLRELAVSCPGCYVPRFYTPHYRADGCLAQMVPEPGLPPRIKPVLQMAPEVAGYSRLLSPRAEFSDLFLVELGRGCSRSCRFCAAGFVYRPPRQWSPAAIEAALARRPPEITRVGLLGMEMAEPATLAAISQAIQAAGCRLSFSSLRADALTPELLRLLKQSGVKTAVLAPDGASERLRRVINKNLAEEDILQAAEALAAIDVRTIKLYCMIGLPSEEDADLLELVAMVSRLRRRLLAQGRRRGWLTEIQLSVSSLVPKPWTPFQYAPFAGVPKLRRRLQLLKRELRSQANVKLSAESPEHAYWQAIVARGDRRLGQALLALAAAGVDNRPSRALAAQGIDPDWYAGRARTADERFPWEIIAPGIKPEYLFKEYQRGLKGAVTEACRVESCRRCGVCGG